MTTQTVQLPDRHKAAAICDQLHLRAVAGMLRQRGIVPQTEKEAHALQALASRVFERHVAASTGQPLSAPQRQDLGDGLFATIKRALDEHELRSVSGPPGFEKSAAVSDEDVLTPLPAALEKAAQDAAYQLCHDPDVYGAAMVHRDTLEKLAAGELVDEPQAADNGPLLPDFQFTS